MESAVEQIEAFTVLGQRQGKTGELLPSENLPEIHVFWLSEDYFHFRYAEVAVTHYHGKGQLPQESHPGVFATSPAYHVKVDGEADWNLADMNAAYEPMDHIVLKTKFM